MSFVGLIISSFSIVVEIVTWFMICLRKWFVTMETSIAGLSSIVKKAVESDIALTVVGVADRMKA